MTTERELLEMAAKACGLHFNPTLRIKQGLHVVRPDARCQSDQVLWNPLRDDGDCARMEAALGIELTWFFDRVDALACDVAPVVEYFKDHAGDMNASPWAGLSSDIPLPLTPEAMKLLGVIEKKNNLGISTTKSKVAEKYLKANPGATKKEIAKAAGYRSPDHLTTALFWWRRHGNLVTHEERPRRYEWKD